ncbi:TonB-dependent receptor domain-containing protein [Pseudoalteromonas porphyrae]|uniref:TonB-dependent receptor n=1 Tax=Pseudoalteromonas porphyrae TaxID=187330 RepID=A0A0N1EMY8_9GAMM|nr:TonB-dependent receptor [Pseudoalteromonas porphyrae]KPH65025.1 TonB-dependent receptor [Pseudoalteromonas porphyrae]
MRTLTKKTSLSLALALAFSSMGYANEAEIEEITVVAKPTSYANNVIEPAMLEQQSSVSSVLSVIDNLPGISINEGDAFGGDDWSTTITMRGFSIDGNQQQLGMTIDGIPNGGSNYGGGAKANRYLDSENLATVEVGQGTSDIASASLEALGGTFNFVSKDPTLERNTTFAYTQGDHNATRFYIKHDTGTLFDNTQAYASYSQTNTSRWIGDGSNGGKDNQHGEIKFVSNFSALTVTGRLSYDDVSETNYNSVSLKQFAQTPDWDQLTWNWTGVPHFDQMFAEGWGTLRENTLGYVKFEYAISPSSLLTVSPYYHKNSGRGDWIPPYLTSPVDTDGKPTTQGGKNAGSYGFADSQGNPLTPDANCKETLSWPWDSGTGLNPACYPDTATPVMSYRHTHYNKDRLGLTADYKLTLGMHDIEAGIWLEQTDRDESRDWHKVIDARIYHHFDSTPYWTQYKNTFETDTFKWYIQDAMTVGDFTFNIGAKQYLVELQKYDHFEAVRSDKINSDSDVLFSAGALYQLNNSTELFASFSENFSAIKDGVLERDGSTLNEIKPETAENIDFGVRYNADRLSLTATAYSIAFDNRITFIAPGSGSDGIDYTVGTNGSYINVGGIDSQGVELSASYMLTNEWNIYTSYTSNSSEYASHDPSAYDANGVILKDEDGNDVSPSFKKGDDVIDSPSDMFVISTDYYSGDFRFGISAKYTGERLGAFLNEQTRARNNVDGYTVLDINAGYAADVNAGPFKSIDIAFAVTNVTDKQYLSGGTGNGSTYFIGAPRTAALTFTATF